MNSKSPLIINFAYDSIKPLLTLFILTISTEPDNTLL